MAVKPLPCTLGTLRSTFAFRKGYLKFQTLPGSLDYRLRVQVRVFHFLSSLPPGFSSRIGSLMFQTPLFARRLAVGPLLSTHSSRMGLDQRLHVTVGPFVRLRRAPSVCSRPPLSRRDWGSGLKTPFGYRSAPVHPLVSNGPSPAPDFPSRDEIRGSI